MLQQKQPPNLRYLDAQVLERVAALQISTLQTVEGLRVGQHRSPLRGFSTEFQHHRQYAPGDAVKHIDWRVYGRTQRYYIKLYEAETNFDAYLLIDASSSMRYGKTKPYGTKLEYAKYLAATMAKLIIEQRDSVGLAVFDSQLRSFVPPASKRGIVGTICQKLVEAHDEPRTDVAALLHDFAQRLKRRSFVMIISDLFSDVDSIAQGLAHLAFGKHNITVFHTMDPDELEFPFKGTCRFVGLENEPEIITQPKRIAAAYKKEVESFTSGLRRACENNHADYVLVNTSRPLDTVLAEYILRRGQLSGVGTTQKR
jgi:uncharacterized protein (DUF58 family)